MTLSKVKATAKNAIDLPDVRSLFICLTFIYSASKFDARIMNTEPKMIKNRAGKSYLHKKLSFKKTIASIT